jgi:hypothetical protein
MCTTTYILGKRFLVGSLWCQVAIRSIRHGLIPYSGAAFVSFVFISSYRVRFDEVAQVGLRMLENRYAIHPSFPLICNDY